MGWFDETEYDMLEFSYFDDSYYCRHRSTGVKQEKVTEIGLQYLPLEQMGDKHGARPICGMLHIIMKTDLRHSSEICIRNAIVDDSHRIVHLIRQLGDDAEVTEDYVHYYLSGTDRHILLAQRGDTVHGLLSYSVRADLFHAGNSVLVEELVVDAGCRGEGIGSALMNALFERLSALNCKEVCLAVMPDNEDAIRFYKRHGLTEEALFLEKHLK